MPHRSCCAGLGAERYGNALAISRGKLIACLREAQEHTDWRWERERRQAIHRCIDTCNPIQLGVRLGVRLASISAIGYHSR